MALQTFFNTIDIVMAYTVPLSSENPGYIVILIDQSGSMSDSFGGNTGGTKAQECAKAVNRVLRELGLACVSGQTIKNRCDISVISYGKSGDQACNAFTGNLANKPIVNMQELAKNALRVEALKIKVSDGAGGLVEVDEQFPVWIEAIADGGTPMTEGFERAYQLVNDWTKSHQNSFPPVVINITDGEPNDQSSAKNAALQLRQLGTNDGKVLVLNAHITSKRAARVELPASASDLPTGDNYAQFLFDISSELPPVMQERASAVGFEVSAGSRGFVYNADAETMIRLLDIGTKAKLR
jgi:hypothetical protein